MNTDEPQIRDADANGTAGPRGRPPPMKCQADGFGLPEIAPLRPGPAASDGLMRNSPAQRSRARRWNPSFLPSRGPRRPCAGHSRRLPKDRGSPVTHGCAGGPELDDAQDAVAGGDRQAQRDHPYTLPEQNAAYAEQQEAEADREIPPAVKAHPVGGLPKTQDSLPPASLHQAGKTMATCTRDQGSFQRSAVSAQRSALSGQRSASSDQLSAASAALSGPKGRPAHRAPRWCSRRWRH